MRAVHHDWTTHLFITESRQCAGDVFRPIVRFSAATAQYNMTIRVAVCFDGGGDTIDVDPHKTMRLAGRHHGVQSDLKASIRSVFKPDRHGQAAGHFAVGLAFRRSGPDGDPA